MIDQFRRKALAILGRFTNGMRYMKIAVVFVIFSFVNVNTERIKYFQPQTIMLEPHSTLEYQVALQDSVSKSDLLYKVSSIDGTPIFFYRKVFSPVCFDNKCRPLTVNLYWNITGRYLGFELPDGEFLSKPILFTMSLPYLLIVMAWTILMQLLLPHLRTWLPMSLKGRHILHLSYGI